MKKHLAALRGAVCSNHSLQVFLMLAITTLIICLYRLYLRVDFYTWSSVASVTESTVSADDYPRRRSRIMSQFKYSEDFRPINQRGIYTFWNVCIEATNEPVLRQRQLPTEVIEYEETKRIVIYDSFFRSGLDSLLTVSSVNALEFRWSLFFSNAQVPATHNWSPDVAFFISQSCPGNFHHFWNDEFNMLFSLMNISNRLRPESVNHVIYRTPSDVAVSESDCDDIHRYEQFFSYVNVVPPHAVFYKMPENTCFRNAVFGMDNLNYDSKMTVRYVLDKAGIKRSNCEPGSRVLVIQRSSRRLLNAEELLEAAIEEGFNDSKVIDLELYSVEEQMRLSACSSVMVGVQGAGLQWAIFMPQNSTLIEIAWPQKFWGFYFNSWVTAYGIRHRQLVTDFVHVNWKTYEAKVRGGEVVGEEERLDLLHTRPKSTIDNIWKWADVILDVDVFRKTLQTIKSTL